MIYKIKFRMADIKSGASDPWELHFNIEENEDDYIINRLKKDFTFGVGGSWIVRANRPEFMIGIYHFKWFIKGSLGHVEGDKKYYSIAAKTVYHKHEFNNAVELAYPQIKDRFHYGQFDSETEIMKILDN